MLKILISQQNNSGSDLKEGIKSLSLPNFLVINPNYFFETI